MLPLPVHTRDVPWLRFRRKVSETGLTGRGERWTGGKGFVYTFRKKPHCLMCNFFEALINFFILLFIIDQ